LLLIENENEKGILNAEQGISTIEVSVTNDPTGIKKGTLV
jgi:hypothetical protein